MADAPPSADLAACKRMSDALRRACETLNARVRTETGVCVVTAEWVDERGVTASKTFRQAGLGGAPPAAAPTPKRKRGDSGSRSAAWDDFVRTHEFGMAAFLVSQLGSHDACVRLCKLLPSLHEVKKNWPQALYWVYFREHVNALERRELEAEAAKTEQRRTASELVPKFATFQAWKRDMLARLASQASSEVAEASAAG